MSAFGFGGTNFHIVMSEYVEGLDVPAFRDLRGLQAPCPAPRAPTPVHTPEKRTPISAPVPTPTPVPVDQVQVGMDYGVPEGLWAVSADSKAELHERVKAIAAGAQVSFDPRSTWRLVAAAADDAAKEAQLARALKVFAADKSTDLLRSRGIYIESVPCDGHLAFVFTGQGSQYIDMGLDLAERYPVMAATFAEADSIMEPILGKSLTAYIRRDESMDEAEQFEALRQTEISQPATLTVDVGIARLLGSFGVFPDMVAGHSLGEYGAAVAAGMLDFRSALLAVVGAWSAAR